MWPVQYGPDATVVTQVGDKQSRLSAAVGSRRKALGGSMLKCLALATTALAVADCAGRVSADGAQIDAAANTPGYSSVAAPPPVPGDRPPIDPGAATTSQAAPALVFTAPATDITECDPGRLPTVEPGYLTVSVVGETSSGSPQLAVALASLEAEVVVGMANVLGYHPDMVRWTKPPERGDVEVGQLAAPMTGDGHTWSAGYLSGASRSINAAMLKVTRL